LGTPRTMRAFPREKIRRRPNNVSLAISNARAYFPRPNGEREGPAQREGEGERPNARYLIEYRGGCATPSP
jgi:hypothetical protein